ncbi:MAG: flavodoxin family protein [Bacteroidales bacterium]|nr:flavodoxin family protein [Bacteroidales bacterium]
MNVLLINGSPNANGCTHTALSVVAETLNQEGISTDLLHIGHKDIRGCIGCRRCAELGHCVFNDIVNETAARFEQADGLVVGSPVYFASANGTLTNFLDRLFYSTPFSKRMKVGAAVCSARRAGTTATFDQLNKYFTISEMPIASSRYWNMVHGNTPEDVFRDEEGVQCMRILARNMAFLLRAVAAEREAHGLPMQEQTVYTNFHS